MQVVDKEVLRNNESVKSQQQRDSITGHIYESIDEDAACEKKNIPPELIGYDEELMMKYTSDISCQSSTSSGRPLFGHNNLITNNLCNFISPPSGPRPPPPPPPRDEFASLFDIIPHDDVVVIMDDTQDVYGSMPDIHQHNCYHPNTNFNQHNQFPNVVHQHSNSMPVDTQNHIHGLSWYPRKEKNVNIPDGNKTIFNPNTNIALCHDPYRNKYSTEC